jgi:hypothetical protein
LLPSQATVAKCASGRPSFACSSLLIGDRVVMYAKQSVDWSKVTSASSFPFIILNRLSTFVDLQLTKTTRVINQHRLSDAKKEDNKPPGIRTLYGRDLKEYDNMPFEDLLNELTEAELEELSNDVDPDDSHIPPSMRCREQTKKAPTGPLNRKKLLEFLKKFALEQEDWPESKLHEVGVKRGT